MTPPGMAAVQALLGIMIALVVSYLLGARGGWLAAGCALLFVPACLAVILIRNRLGPIILRPYDGRKLLL